MGWRVKSKKELQSIKTKPFSEILVLGVITGAGFLSNERVIKKKTNIKIPCWLRELLLHCTFAHGIGIILWE